MCTEVITIIKYMCNHSITTCEFRACPDKGTPKYPDTLKNYMGSSINRNYVYDNYRNKNTQKK